MRPHIPDDLQLILDDGEPLESKLHTLQIPLLLELTYQVMVARGHTRYYAGGNQFIYYSVEQARFVATHPPAEYRRFTGPDYFFVNNVLPRVERQAWIAWEEDWRYPDVIIELLSPSTRHIDEGAKKRRYQDLFRTAEYYLYEPGGDDFQAFHLGEHGYVEAPRSEQGRVWSEQLGVWIGPWHGDYREHRATWLRFFDRDDQLILASFEEVRVERQRADAAEQERDALAAELARLRALLGE